MEVLVPVDGSDCSVRALNFATESAARYDGTLHVIHSTDHRGRRRLDIFQRAEAVHADAEIEDHPDVPSDLRLSDPRYAHRIGKPRFGNRIGKDILAIATEEHYDHIIMGYYGTDRIGRAILGSAAETVIQATDPPATIIP